MRNRNVIYTLLFALLLLNASAVLAQKDAAHHIYLEAKKKSFGQQWGPAAQLFQQLVDAYPASDYREEAQFWVGYCLEKDGSAKSAYHAFTQLQNNFPNSLWLDDALQHKIVLAEKLASRRGDQYYAFLRGQLQHPDKDIQYQAAMALGHLGDKSALATFKSLRGHVQFDEETEGVIAALEKAKEFADEAVFAEGVVGSFSDEDPQSLFRINPRDDRVNYFPERRFEQYRSLTRKDDNWNKAELLRFGLWHIVPTEAFDEFNSLDAEAKREWLRLFWKKNDPTPTTPENEGEEEFKRRVVAARNSFNYYDNLKNFNYAPWDARGEIYVKFGSPAKRVRNNDGELWTYPQYDNVTFFIRPNVTNIFGRSIFISSLNNQSLRSGSRFGDVGRWRLFHNKFVFQPGFYFSLQTDFAPIKGFKLLTSRKSGPGLEFQYKMPTNAFVLQERDGMYCISYLESYVIFNEKMDEIVRRKATREIINPRKRDFKKKKVIEQNVRVELAPGDYTLGLRIEDPYSKKIAIRKMNIKIGNE